MSQTTPASINEEVINFCKEIDFSRRPLFVEVIPVKGYMLGDCYGNVKNHIKQNGGNVQYGWIIWEDPNIYLEAEFHSVWVNDKGEYIEVTPKVDNEDRILFLPDSERKFTGELIDNIRKPLVDNDYTRKLVQSGKINFETKNRLYRESLGVKKKKIGRNEPCPCGSGKKYKKCCLVS